jgi:hypothetical protein
MMSRPTSHDVPQNMPLGLRELDIHLFLDSLMEVS